MKFTGLHNRLKMKTAGRGPDIKLRIKTEKTFGIEEEQSILCKNCGNPVTFQGSIISVDGNHTHTFTNPSGVTFEISCFSSADGCVIAGDPTDEDTWFEGFSWSYSHCSSCMIHLGWFYQSEHENFFGLILELLTYTSRAD